MTGQTEGTGEMFRACCLTLLTVCLLVARPASASPAQVLEVSDGDTLVVRAQGQRVRVRLTGIDAPETAHGPAPGQEPWGTKARLALLALVGGRTVTISPDAPPVDRYGRWLAVISVADVDVNRRLVADGWALTYRRGLSPERLAILQAEERRARAAAKGIWRRIGGLAELPGDYRRRWREPSREPAIAR
jgi:endonuclease YncB( thermonuclease family)